MKWSKLCYDCFQFNSILIHAYQYLPCLLLLELIWQTHTRRCKNKVQIAQADECQQKPSWLLQNVLIVIEQTLVNPERKKAN